MKTLVAIGTAMVLAACGGSDDEQEPVDPSAAANFRGYAAVQEDLYSAFLEPGSAFELFRYLGDDGEALSRLVGRPDGFGVTFDPRTGRPNGMSVLIWRMLLLRFSTDLAQTCPGSTLEAAAEPRIVLNARAASVVGALCSWPNVTDDQLKAAWDLSVSYLAPKTSRDGWLAMAKDPELVALGPDQALPSLWVAAFLHPSFLLEH
jgi:hypothetical protein